MVSASDLNLVPLQQANLCLDCEMISTGPSKCLACGSRAFLNIARALDKLGYPAASHASSQPSNAVISVVFRKEVPRPGNFADST